MCPPFLLGLPAYHLCMQDKYDIPFKHWSLKVGRADPQTGERRAFWGEIVAGLDDLTQSITNLILTPLGSVPTEPLKGCDLQPYIDRHPNIAIPQIQRAIWDAIAIWEPRVTVSVVRVYEAEYARLVAEVHWQPAAGVLDDQKILTVPLVAGEERLAS